VPMALELHLGGIVPVKPFGVRNLKAILARD